jgi:nicotinamidase-related amidase
MPIDPKTTALLLIEYQNDFTSEGGALHPGVKAVMESTNMLANSVQLANQARAAGVTVMFAPISFAKGYREITAHPYGILKGVVDANAFVRGTWGAAITDAIAPAAEDIIIEGKRGLDTFASTNLDFILRSRGITTLAVAGFLTNCCVESTARTGYEKGLSGRRRGRPRRPPTPPAVRFRNGRFLSSVSGVSFVSLTIRLLVSGHWRGPRDFRPLSPSQALSRGFCPTSQRDSPLSARDRFGPSLCLRRTTMASADFWQFFLAPLDASSPKANCQISPGIARSPSRLYLSDIRHSVPCKYWALRRLARSPRCAASYPLPVRQASALPTASSRFRLATDTLAVQLTLPLAGCVGDFHPQVSAPCRAHQVDGNGQGAAA